jgi:hypothetical protein
MYAQVTILNLELATTEKPNLIPTNVSYIPADCRTMVTFVFFLLYLVECDWYHLGKYILFIKRGRTPCVVSLYACMH